MPHYFTCKFCRKRFANNPRLGGKPQQYCNSKPCQRERKRQWEFQSKLNNPEKYKTRKKEKNARWRKEKPVNQYQKQYREQHPDYEQINREQQLLRNQKRQQKTDTLKIVKTDTLPSETCIPSGLYKLIPIKTEDIEKIVKTDAIIVKIDQYQGQGINQTIPSG